MLLSEKKVIYVEIIALVFFFLTLLVDPISGISWKISFILFLLLALKKELPNYLLFSLALSATPFILSLIRFTIYKNPIQFFELKFLFFCFLIFAIHNSKNLTVEKCKSIYLTTLCSVLLVSIFAYFSKIYIPFYDGRFRAFNSPNSLGLYCTIGITILVTKRSKLTTLDYSALLIVLFALFFSDSRNAYFNCLIVLAICFLYFIQRRQFTRQFTVFFVLISFPVVLSVFSIYKSRLDLTKYLGIELPKINLLKTNYPTILSPKVTTTTNNKSTTTQSYSEEEMERRLFNGRKAIWTVAFNVIMENRIIGIGKRNFSENYNLNIKKNLKYYIEKFNIQTDEVPIDTTVRDPHNLALGTFCDYGIIIGSMIILVYIIAYIISFFKMPDLFFVLSVFFLNGITNYHIYRPITEIIFSISLLFIIPFLMRYIRHSTLGFNKK
jgi:hypothetical protein